MSAETSTTERFIVDASGRRESVILDVQTYERLCAAAEELGDIQLYDEAVATARRELADGDVTMLSDYRVTATKTPENGV